MREDFQIKSQEKAEERVDKAQEDFLLKRTLQSDVARALSSGEQPVLQNLESRNISSFAEDVQDAKVIFNYDEEGAPESAMAYAETGAFDLKRETQEKEIKTLEKPSYWGELRMDKMGILAEREQYKRIMEAYERSISLDRPFLTELRRKNLDDLSKEEVRNIKKQVRDEIAKFNDFKNNYIGEINELHKRYSFLNADFQERYNNEVVYNEDGSSLLPRYLQAEWERHDLYPDSLNIFSEYLRDIKERENELSEIKDVAFSLNYKKDKQEWEDNKESLENIYDDSEQTIFLDSLANYLGSIEQWQNKINLSAIRKENKKLGGLTAEEVINLLDGENIKDIYRAVQDFTYGRYQETYLKKTNEEAAEKGYRVREVDQNRLNILQNLLNKKFGQEIIQQAA